MSGFTLTELIVVIIIIGVLASLAIPTFSDSTNNARAKEAIEQLDLIKGAMNICFQERGENFGTVGNPCNFMNYIADPTLEPGARFRYNSLLPLADGSFMITAELIVPASQWGDCRLSCDNPALRIGGNMAPHIALCGEADGRMYIRGCGTFSWIQ